MRVPVLAHHSPAAFDRTKEVTLVGTVKEFRWQNPHTWIEVLVPDEKGEEVLWGVELTSPTYLIRAGWKSNTIKPGDKVTVVGEPGAQRRAGRNLRSLTLADGRALTRAARAARHGGLEVGRHATTDCCVRALIGGDRCRASCSPASRRRRLPRRPRRPRTPPLTDGER